MSPDENRTFHSALAIADMVRHRVVRELMPATGLSAAEYIVLDRLHYSPDHTYAGLKAMAAKMHWSPSRLSHQLSRMEKRGLLVREQADKASRVIITLTDHGKEITRHAVLVHADAVRRYLLTHLTEEEAATLNAMADRLREAPGG